MAQEHLETASYRYPYVFGTSSVAETFFGDPTTYISFPDFKEMPVKFPASMIVADALHCMILKYIACDLALPDECTDTDGCECKIRRYEIKQAQMQKMFLIETRFWLQNPFTAITSYLVVDTGEESPYKIMLMNYDKTLTGKSDRDLSVMAMKMLEALPNGWASHSGGFIPLEVVDQDCIIRTTAYNYLSKKERMKAGMYQ